MPKKIIVCFTDDEFEILKEYLENQGEDQSMSDFLKELILRGPHLEKLIEDIICIPLDQISKYESRNNGYLDTISLMVSTLLDFTPGRERHTTKKIHEKTGKSLMNFLLRKES